MSPTEPLPLPSSLLLLLLVPPILSITVPLSYAVYLILSYFVPLLLLLCCTAVPPRPVPFAWHDTRQTGPRV